MCRLADDEYSLFYFSYSLICLEFSGEIITLRIDQWLCLQHNVNLNSTQYPNINHELILTVTTGTAWSLTKVTQKQFQAIFV